MIQIVKTEEFINRLTQGRYKEDRKNLNRIVAYLRANGLCFYDDWSRDHVSILDKLQDNKTTVLSALKEGFKHYNPNE